MLSDAHLQRLIAGRRWEVYDLITRNFTVQPEFTSEFPELAEQSLITGAVRNWFGSIRSGGKVFKRPRNEWRSSEISATALPKNSGLRRSFSSVRTPMGRRHWNRIFLSIVLLGLMNFWPV